MDTFLATPPQVSPGSGRNGTLKIHLHFGQNGMVTVECTPKCRHVDFGGTVTFETDDDCVVEFTESSVFNCGSIELTAGGNGRSKTLSVLTERQLQALNRTSIETSFYAYLVSPGRPRLEPPPIIVP